MFSPFLETTAILDAVHFIGQMYSDRTFKSGIFLYTILVLVQYLSLDYNAVESQSIVLLYC